MASKSIIGDLDVYGREHADGTAFEVYDDQAIGNSLTLWMVSKKGDFLMYPDIFLGIIYYPLVNQLFRKQPFSGDFGAGNLLGLGQSIDFLLMKT